MSRFDECVHAKSHRGSPFWDEYCSISDKSKELLDCENCPHYKNKKDAKTNAEGNIYWGYDFIMGKRKVKYSMQPRRGVLSKEKWSIKSCDEQDAIYFIPLLDSDKPELLLSIPVASIHIAKTEKEATEKYNAMVKKGFDQLMANAQNYLNYFTPGYADDYGLRGKLEDLKFDN